MLKKMTKKRLENIALFYLERYESSCAKLKSVLEHRILKSDNPEQEAFSWIDEIVMRMQELGYVDDSRYAENKLQMMTRQGRSVSYMTAKLKQDGISSDVILHLLQESLGNREDFEYNQAKAFIKRRKIILSEKVGDYQKALAKLARAGFSYEVAKRALDD